MYHLINRKTEQAQRARYIFSGEHEKIAARAQVLLEPRGQHQNTDSHSNAVDVQIGRSCFYCILHRQTVDFRALCDRNLLPHVSILICSVCLIDHGRLTVYLRDLHSHLWTLACRFLCSRAMDPVVHRLEA